VPKLGFAAQVALAALAGLLVRVAYVTYYAATIGDPAATGDSFHYHELANLLADGQGFVEPFRALSGESVQAASHPPLFSVVLAVASTLGLRSVGAHQAVGVLLGTTTIVLLALLARQVAGERAALIAAGFAAAYPALWIHDALLLSETLAITLVAAALLAAYRYVEAPNERALAAMGLVVGFATLARSENALLLPAMVVPLVVRAARGDRHRLGRGLAVGMVAVALPVLPWTAYNSTRFDQPVLLSDQLGVTLLMANCDSTYHGDLIGYWNLRCAGVTPGTATFEGDRSVRDAALREAAVDYIADNVGALPKVVLVRMARVWGIWDPAEQLRIDVGTSNRELRTSQLAFVSVCGSAYLAVLGGVVLRRRGTTLVPLVAPVVIVTVTAALIYGNPRFRAIAEVSIVVLAAIGIEDLWNRRTRAAPVASDPTPSGDDTLHARPLHEAGAP
jgi:hypothetical protein